jgi:hypothetical protein
MRVENRCESIKQDSSQGIAVPSHSPFPPPVASYQNAPNWQNPTLSWFVPSILVLLPTLMQSYVCHCIEAWRETAQTSIYTAFSFFLGTCDPICYYSLLIQVWRETAQTSIYTPFCFFLGTCDPICCYSLLIKVPIAQSATYKWFPPMLDIQRAN